PIKIDKIDVSKADVTLDPTKDSLAALNNINLNVNSPFITLNGGGASLSRLNIKGTFDLDKLREQLANFIDFKDTKLSGKGTINVMDPATAQQQIDPFVPALSDNGLRITAGQLYTNVSGSIDGKTRTIKFDPGNPLVLTTPGLTVQKVTDDGKALDLLKGEEI